MSFGSQPRAIESIWDFLALHGVLTAQRVSRLGGKQMSALEGLGEACFRCLTSAANITELRLVGCRASGDH